MTMMSHSAPADTGESDPRELLAVSELATEFDTPEGLVHAVNGVTIEVGAGEIVAIIGESGSGKSVVGKSLLRLPGARGRISGGTIRFRGRDLLSLNTEAMRKVRGSEISLVPQNYSGAFNPVARVGAQITAVLRAHSDIDVKDCRSRAIDLLERTGVRNPEKMVDAYPAEFSGGMLQRAAIAMALACGPSLVIADEPTTALDPTMRDRVLALLASLRDENGTSIIIISHDLSSIAGFADRVYIMYAGRVVEHARTEEIFEHPQHPYTEALLKSVPRMDQPRGERLEAVRGAPPNPLELPTGCHFHPRCPYAMDRCRTEYPPYAVSDETPYPHSSACWLSLGYREDGAEQPTALPLEVR